MQKTAESIEMPFGGPALVRRSNYAIDGVEIPPREMAILWKHMIIHRESAAVYAAKRSFNHQQRHDSGSATVQTGRCHMTLSPVKNPPPAMRPFVKILRPLVMAAEGKAIIFYRGKFFISSA